MNDRHATAAAPEVRANRPVVRAGSLLLADVDRDPSWSAHRRRTGPVPSPDLATLVSWCREVDLLGRGGAGFPFAPKVAASAEGRRPLVVVNAAEGEPASHKDRVLMTSVPHLVLDGAAATAAALGTRELHVVVPRDRPDIVRATEIALAERARAGEPGRWHVHHASAGFVSGQARAVVELMAGRRNLPVTAWQPEALVGHRGRPTLLSNAETFAHVAALSRIGPRAYREHGYLGTSGTVLLTVDGDGPAPEVLELPGGSPLVDALAIHWLPGQPVLLGGYHGTWMSGEDVARTRLDRTELTASGFALGAGVVLPLTVGTCPLERTARIVRYLAGESARRCGPCRFGLPTLADELELLVRGLGDVDRVRQLAGLVSGRGACAHPDGTARLVASMFTVFADETARHVGAGCGWPSRGRTVAAT